MLKRSPFIFFLSAALTSPAFAACSGDDDDGQAAGTSGRAVAGGGPGGQAGKGDVGGAAGAPNGGGGRAGAATAGRGGAAGEGDQGGQGGGPAGQGGQGGATPATGLDVEQYVLRGAFDWASRTLRASVEVTFRGPAEGGASLELDVNVNALTVEAVRGPGGEALAFAVGGADDRGDAKLRVELGPAAPAPGGSAAVRVEYRATPWVSLSAVAPRLGDPATGRVAYTASEPLGVAEWMPCHNDPSDRARVSVTFDVPPGEALVANGTVTGDVPLDGGGRRVTYATAYALPTYLMAFAVGGLEAERAQAGALPLAVWHRAGVGGDYAGVLGELARLVPLYEGLLGVAYPFEKYELVLLPEFRFGGVEHAGITFQKEEISTNPYETKADLLVTAHELAHQWFGDLVTVKTWDDLWVKEGMATFLQHEGTRLYLDESGAGPLNGDLWQPFDGYAIRDVALPPPAKYTPGPYDRAAWLIAQLRSLAGENAFWGALRAVLEGHAFGAITTDEFLEAFRPALGDEAFARARAAVDAHALFSVRATAPAAPGAGPTVRLVDPEGSVLVPMRVRWLRADGASDDLVVGPAPLELRRASPDDLLVIDPDDVHPLWRENDGGPLPFLGPLQRPSAALLARFTSLAGANQAAALDEGPLPPAVGPAGLVGFLEALDSPYAEARALDLACELAAEDAPAWAPALREALSTRPNYRAGRRPPRTGCARAVDPASLFAADWAALAAGQPTTSEARLDFLAALAEGLPASTALATWGRLVKQGHSLRVRQNAASTLRTFAGDRPDAVPPAERPSWRAALTETIADTHQPLVLVDLIPVLVAMRSGVAADNAAGLDALAGAIVATSVQPFGYFVASDALCGAYQLAAGDASFWKQFIAKLLAADLDPEIRPLVESLADGSEPSGCQSPGAAAARSSTPSARAGRPGPAAPPAHALETKGEAAGR
jgi:hypothetical protein